MDHVYKILSKSTPNHLIESDRFPLFFFKAVLCRAFLVLVVLLLRILNELQVKLAQVLLEFGGGLDTEPKDLVLGSDGHFVIASKS
jgi:hypothetical protein